MHDGWRILDLSGLTGVLAVDRGGVVVVDTGTPVDRVPAADLALVLVGPGVQLSSGVLQRFADHDTWC